MLCEVCCSNLKIWFAKKATNWTQLKECVLRHWPAEKFGRFKLDIGTKNICKRMVLLVPWNEGHLRNECFFPVPDFLPFGST
jgi:hypothetical protein